jgi:hypothetical protein
MATPKLKYIDCTPTWASLMPALFAVFENGTELGKKMAREELMDLARKVDAINARTGGRP